MVKHVQTICPLVKNRSNEKQRTKNQNTFKLNLEYFEIILLESFVIDLLLVGMSHNYTKVYTVILYLF